MIDNINNRYCPACSSTDQINKYVLMHEITDPCWEDDEIDTTEYVEAIVCKKCGIVRLKQED